LRLVILEFFLNRRQIEIHIAAPHLRVGAVLPCGKTVAVANAVGVPSLLPATGYLSHLGGSCQ